MKTQFVTALLFLLPAVSLAQVPVDDDGNIIGNYESQAEIMPIGEDGIPRLSHTELQELVGPIALYPDDLLAIVLPAAAYPLQVVEAARFLEALETDPTLQPDPEWDDSIIALINYPEIVDLLNDDLDWTWRLGESVVAQQTDVIAAVESFRDRAYAAGNLKTDEYQTVSNDEGIISISPTAEDVIYVPYYEPTRVVTYQPRPAYYYHPSPYPVYYYPYSANHYFDRRPFWGVTTAFSIGWYTDSLHVYHQSYRGHPYYGRTYWNDGWYRRPSISVYNTTYVNNTNVVVNHQSNGDQWRARDNRRAYVQGEGYSKAEKRWQQRRVVETVKRDKPITFRERESRPVNSRSTRREDAVVQYRGKRQSAAERDRVAQQRSRVEQSRTRPQETRREEAVVRARDTRSETAIERSRKTSAYRPESSRQTREPARQSREQMPTRATVRAPAPAPREHRQAEVRTREPAASRPRESRSQDSRSSTSSPRKSASSSKKHRTQDKD